MKKIVFEDMDDFIDGISKPNRFVKYDVLREIKQIDKCMNYQEPGKYKITITIEEAD